MTDLSDKIVGALFMAFFTGVFLFAAYHALTL